MLTLRSHHPADVDPRRWQRCLDAAGAAMVAAGWIRRSLKFDEVCHRRALRLWLVEAA